ncbi:MAG: hypothetical protein K9W45_08865 [Candidatus Heimdallarchaeum aukensis]|uniref:Uncharacterized protein n=1 Tax=Candidatus Heimdallarchaeum aukensis TaxID=2876573 RepID=A0A9Y1BJ21_9ARCH|nr:MAG: hypothetical protein K9W45_08865 [Candidatus Heimdallarchaeum aukensis]
MVTRVHFCQKCGRPIKRSGYCEDCASELNVGIKNRCSFCGKSNLMSPLAYNLKTKHVYCKTCLDLFVKGLRSNHFTEHEIKKIIDKDFIPVR